MKTYVIAGGTGAVGFEVFKKLYDDGHKIILLARNQAKTEKMLADFDPNRVKFIPSDLTTNAGVRQAAVAVKAETNVIDGLLHSAQIFETRDVRTEDNIPIFAAIGYLSRFHLTELLLSELLKSEAPKVLMMIAGMKKIPEIHPEKFREFPDFSFKNYFADGNGACLYYAKYLNQKYPKVLTACVSPGFIASDLFDEAPLLFRLYVKFAGPFLANSAEEAARNPYHIFSSNLIENALNFPKVKQFDQRYEITVDQEKLDELIKITEELTKR